MGLLVMDDGVIATSCNEVAVDHNSLEALFNGSVPSSAGMNYCWQYKKAVVDRKKKQVLIEM